MTGQCRQLWLTAPSLYKNVIEPNDADVFLYLNKNSMEPLVDNEEEIVKNVFNKNVKGLTFTDENYNNEVADLIKNNYSKIDSHYKKLNRDQWDKQLNHHNTDQYLKVKKCCEAAVDYANKNNFKYDLILRIRPDIGWLNKFDLLRPVEANTLYVNHSLYNVSADSFISRFVDWVEDTCFFGDQESMLKFCSAFSDKMVDELEICDEKYDLSCATEKLLARVLINSGIKFTGINNYFGYSGPGWIRPKLAKYFTDWKKSPNFPLIEKFCCGKTGGLAVYFDRISENNIVMDNSLII